MVETEVIEGAPACGAELVVLDLRGVKLGQMFACHLGTLILFTSCMYIVIVHCQVHKCPRDGFGLSTLANIWCDIACVSHPKI